MKYTNSHLLDRIWWWFKRTYQNLRPGYGAPPTRDDCRHFTAVSKAQDPKKVAEEYLTFIDLEQTQDVSAT